jgi:tripartite-type tricarboxylate transporter receptor subunit TctC
MKLHPPRTGRRAALRTLLAAPLVVPRAGRAQEAYPSRPIRLVVPFAPGGGTDILGRTLAQKLGPALGTTVIVENRPGAGGNLGAEQVAYAAPDGYTLLIVSASYAVNASFQPPKFDPVRGLAPIAQIASVPFLLLARVGGRGRAGGGLGARARARPGQLTYASSGVGSSPHLAGEMLASLSSIRMIHVPYKGGGPAITDLLGGQVDLLFATVVQGLPHVKAGKLRALGVGGTVRAPQLPEVPTIAESGVPGFDITNWFGVLAPAGTPAPILERLNRDIVQQLGTAEMKERLTAEGADPRGSSATEFARLIESDVRKYTQIVRAAGIKAQ